MTTKEIVLIDTLIQARIKQADSKSEPVRPLLELEIKMILEALNKGATAE